MGLETFTKSQTFSVPSSVGLPYENNRLEARSKLLQIDRKTIVGYMNNGQTLFTSTNVIPSHITYTQKHWAA